jgi:RNA recognition motif-containing protein
MIKLFVGGFPLDTNELELVKLISPYAEVSTIKIVRDKKTQLCKGYAFLEVTTQEGAELAIDELSGTTWEGRELTINITEEKPAAPAPRYTSARRSPGNYNSGSSSNYNNSGDKPKRPRRT